MNPHWEKIMSATVLWLLHSKYWEYSKMLYDMWKVKIYIYICSKKINKADLPVTQTWKLPNEDFIVVVNVLKEMKQLENGWKDEQY